MTSGTVYSLALAGTLFTPSLMLAMAGSNTSVGSDATWVRGRVTYNGSPVSDAGIVFRPSQRPSGDFTVAPTNGDGSFALTLFRGRYEIYLLPASNTDRGRASKIHRPNGRATPGTPASHREENFPARFSDPRMSQLSVTIGDRAYHIEIDLKD